MTRPGPFQLEVHSTARQAACAVARHILMALRQKPVLVLGLPTGRTPIDLYRELVRRHRNGEADLSQMSTFNLDEFLGVSAEHAGSYRRYMDRHLLRHIHIGPERVHMLNGAALDPETECDRYERALTEAGGIDLQVLGIGNNGHIGFNEPGPFLVARTHRAQLRPQTRRSNAAYFGGDWTNVPEEALSMGMATILQARAIILLATGHAKASPVERMIRGPVTTRLPASFLQLHSQVRVVLDAQAAARVEGKVKGKR